MPRRTPAFAFLPLMLPFGIASGYAVVTLENQLAQHGMSAGAVAALGALSVWPQTWKWAWAPIVDATLGYKRWYLVGLLLLTTCFFGFGLVPAEPSQAARLGTLIVLSSMASTVVSMSAEGLMAISVEDARRGSVGGWSMGGNLGGQGLGGGLALVIAQHMQSQWAPGFSVAVVSLACAAALPLVHPYLAPEHRPAVVSGLIDVGRGLVSLCLSRAGLLVAVLMVMPIGSGGAQNVWAAIATDWQAGPDTVALVTGALSGVASLVGSVIGGKLCDRFDRKTAYCVYGLTLCAVAVAMAVMPRSPGVFVAMTMAYAVVLGACYAAYNAAVLEVVGTTGAATKFQLLSAISNVPIALITTWDGELHDWRGANGTLFGEAAIGAAGVLLFMLFARVTRGIRLPLPAALSARAAEAPVPRRDT